jgi:hypothetical protein
MSALEIRVRCPDAYVSPPPFLRYPHCPPYIGVLLQQIFVPPLLSIFFFMSAVPATLLSDKTTWAKQNALQKIQPSREPARKLTDAEKASRQLAAGLKKQNQIRLNEAVGAYILERSTKLQELADAHNVKVTKIEEMVNAATHYRKARTPSLANAIVHYLAKTVNGG